MDNTQPTLLSAAWKHRILVAIVMAVFVLFGLAFLASQQDARLYDAEALVVLQDPDSEGVADSRFIAEQVEIMSSPIVADAAANLLEEEDAEIQASATDLLDATTVTSSPNSTLVIITAVDDDSAWAVAMANALANGYQEVTHLQATQSSVAALERIDAQIEGLESRFSELSADIQAERDSNVELARLEEQFNGALTRIAELQEELETAGGDEAEAIRTEISDLQTVIANYQQASTTSRNSSELQALLEEQAQLIDRRTELLQRRDQIAIDAELAPSAVALLQPATEALEFSPVPRTRVMMVALALGGFTAIGISYLLELRRRTFSSRMEPQTILGSPLLADIPSFVDENLASRLPVRESPASAAAEGFRFAAAAIEEAMRTREAKSVMMVSSTVGHGKSTCIVNTAMADARRGHSVLLMDCDFGTQDAARLALGSEPVTRAGLVDVIEDDVPFYKAITNLSLGAQTSLSLLGQGTRPAGAANLGTESKKILDRAHDEFDVVFLDGPPLLQVAYASTLANQVDALVVVVSHGTPVREMEDLVGRLQLVDTPVLGYLYNRSPLRREMTRREGSMRDIFQDESSIGTGSRLRWLPDWVRRTPGGH